MALQAVFIDVGNTLLYEKPSRFEIYAAEARTRGISLETAEMLALMRRAHRELPREVHGAYRYSDAWFTAYIERIFHTYLGLSKEHLTPLAAGLFERFSAPDTFGVFEGGLALLEDWRARGLKIGIISNWSARLPGILQHLGIASRVDFVLCSALERLEKPDPLIFERALALAEVSADRALHCGDDVEKDLHAPQRVGIRAVLVDHAGTADRAHTPRVGSLAELGELVTRLAR